MGNLDGILSQDYVDIWIDGLGMDGLRTMGRLFDRLNHSPDSASQEIKERLETIYLSDVLDLPGDA